MANSKAIGVFDSGVGGISVVKELHRIMPQEKIVFFGDNRNAPYGTKTPEEVLYLAERDLLFLREKECKIAVIACNTATAAAADILRAKYPDFPIVGMEPAVKPAATSHPGGKVLIMATPLTLRHPRVLGLIERFSQTADLQALPCKGLVELIESGHLFDETLFAFLKELLLPQIKGVSAVVLGCTHYPHIRKALRHVLGQNIALYDGGEGTARRTQFLLSEKNALTDETENGEITLYTSSDDPKVLPLCRKLLAE